MSSSILIPVQGSDEVVEVHVDELPEDVNDVIDILQAEMAPLDLWLRFAVEYYKQGLSDHFKSLLKPLLELAETRPHPPNQYENMLFEQFHTDPNAKAQFVAILNALASCHLATASRERDKSKRKAGFEQAKKYFNQAQKMDLLNAGSMVGEAVLLLSQGDLERASAKLDSAADYCRGNVPVLLAKACAKFQGGAVEESRRLYREVFALNPSPPPAVRLGLAYTSAKLGQSAVARKAFERALELDPECVEALAGLGVLECNEGRVESGMARLGQAHALEPSHPIVLNRLADHFFLRGEYDQAKALAQRAFRHSTSPSVRAEAAYHMGRVFHAQIDFSSALQWYSQASKEAPTFLPPHYGLGQVRRCSPRYSGCLLPEARAGAGGGWGGLRRMGQKKALTGLNKTPTGGRGAEELLNRRETRTSPLGLPPPRDYSPPPPHVLVLTPCAAIVDPFQSRSRHPRPPSFLPSSSTSAPTASLL
jgi:RNA polymerase-associated protein CTR9